MVAAMSHQQTSIDSVLATADSLGRTRAGRSSLTSWTETDPLLASWDSVGELLAAARAAEPVLQDCIVAALLRPASGDELAQLAVIAVLSRGLGAMVTGWARAGVPVGERRDLEADLVSGCWLAVADLAGRVSAGESVPARVGLRLLDRARQSVRTTRRRQERTDLHLEPLLAACEASAGDRPVCDALAVEIVRAVGDRRITRAEAAQVFLTRVAGFDVAETARRLGTTPGTVRSARSRAERRLAAA